MLPRQRQLFKNIVEEYIKSAQPVGSKLVVDKFRLDLSPATVRNDMVELENQDLITHPHTSAGRIPTEYGYREYINEHIDLNQQLSTVETEALQQKLNSQSTTNLEDKTKSLSKILAEQSGLGVFVAFGPNSSYYTGLTNIFSQPEFKDLNLIYNISAVIDHLDEKMKQIYNQISDVEIKIGEQNPFSSDCATVIVKTKEVLMGIVGPLRMNYKKNVQLINFVKTII